MSFCDVLLTKIDYIQKDSPGVFFDLILSCLCFFLLKFKIIFNVFYLQVNVSNVVQLQGVCDCALNLGISSVQFLTLQNHFVRFVKRNETAYILTRICTVVATLF